MRSINVLSLFDGMACGRIALEHADIKVNQYFASEIDKYVIKVANANYPDIVHIGDVKNVSWFGLPQIDLLIGGSPCEGFSTAGKGHNFNDPRSALFFEYVRILLETKPRFFLLENVKMKKEWQDTISSFLGIEPVEINSTLVSAQNRKRLYWCGQIRERDIYQFKITQPEDCGILLKDIIEDGLVDRDKSYCVLPGVNDRATYKHYKEHRQHQIVMIPPQQNGYIYDINGKLGCLDTNKGEGEKIGCIRIGTANILGHDSNKRIYSVEGKSSCLLSSTGGHREPKIAVDGTHWRKLTPVECERLQTVPDNYTSHVSNSQRYKMLGKGWTVDVITHIFKSLKRGFLNE